MLAYTAILNYGLTRTKQFRLQGVGKLILAASTAGVQTTLGLIGWADVRGLVLGLCAGQVITALFLMMRSTPRNESNSTETLKFSRLGLARKYWKMPALNGPNALVDAIRINGINFAVGAISQNLLGQFSMALRSTQAPVSLIGQSLSQVFLQKMARDEPGTRLKSALTIVQRGFLIAFAPFLLAFVVSPRLFPWLLGQAWVESGLIAQALIPWLFLNVISSPLANIFIIVQKQGRLLLFAIVYMLVPLATLYLLGNEPLYAVRVMSMSLAILLGLQIGLALITAWQSDRDHTSANRG